jgi:hypothetical protein
MKKLLLCAVLVSLSTAGIAQEKKVKAGLGYQFGMNFNKPGTKSIERNGVGVQNSLGLNLQFGLSGNLSLATGLEFDFESFKYGFVTENPTYYRFSDTDIQKFEDLDTSNSIFQLSERKYKNTFVTVPLMLMFETNPIGDFVYYGKFGARTSFLLKSTVNDSGTLYDSGNKSGLGVASDNDGMSAPYGNDVFIFRTTVGLAGGAQWNFTGNTNLFAELGFYYGVTPVHVGGSNQENMTLFTYDVANPTAGEEYFRLRASQSQLCLKIGILF